MINSKFHQKEKDTFNNFAQKIDHGYMLELARPGGSNEYPQSMFWSKSKKNRFIPANPSLSIRYIILHEHVFLMVGKLCIKCLLQSMTYSAYSFKINMELSDSYNAMNGFFVFDYVKSSYFCCDVLEKGVFQSFLQQD